MEVELNDLHVNNRMQGFSEVYHEAISHEKHQNGGRTNKLRIYMKQRVLLLYTNIEMRV